MDDTRAKIEDMRYWSRLHDVIANKVSIINQMHNCRYARNYANPAQHRHRGGTYEVEIYGEVVASYALYDVEGTEKALERMQMLTDLYWNGTAHGWLVARPESRDQWAELAAV